MPLFSTRRFPRIRIATASEQVTEALRGEISTRVWAVGERLPAEDDLAEQMGVSRGTLRAALRRLAEEGLLESRRGGRSGTFVRVRRTGAVTVESLLASRRLVEVPAAIAAARRSRGNATDLVRLADADDVDQRGHQLALRTFHETILDLAGNPLWRSMAAPLYDWSAAHLDRGVVDGEARSQMLHDHRQIARAVHAGDAAEAGRTMAAHLDHVGASYGDILNP